MEYIMEYEEWYHTVALQEYALETLQEEYCYQYHKLFGKYPLPSVMNRDTLISEIKRINFLTT
tara:strand:+ start:1654 stop:1842 length:189 start_codon:yes stop_codon:yes gene_type:complete